MHRPLFTMGRWQHGAVPSYVSHHDAGLSSLSSVLILIYTNLLFDLNRDAMQLIAAVDKPKIERFAILEFYVLSLFANEHPDVLATIMINCVKMVETTIEYHNSRVSMYVPM